MLRVTKLVPNLRPCILADSGPSRHLKGRVLGSQLFSSMQAAGDNVQAAGASFSFGKYPIDASEVFLTTSLSFAFVNLRPVVPDVLICPKRVLPRFEDLSAEEVSDLWLTAKLVGKKVEQHFKASSLTFAVQDGPQAGQTVPHVHVHILPRKAGDFKNNDEIYDEIDKKEQDLSEKLDLDQERKDRTPDEMAKEAAELRALFS